METLLTNIFVVAEHFARQPIFVVLMVFVLALLNNFGRSFGLPALIYHHHPRTRLINGFALGALVGWIGFVAHLAQWQDWAGQTGFDMSEWHEQFPGVPPHAGYYLLYTLSAIALCLPFAAFLARLGRAGAADTAPVPAEGLMRRATIPVGLLIGLLFVFLLVTGLAKWLGLFAVTWVDETPFPNAKAWPKPMRFNLGLGILVSCFVISLLAEYVPVLRRLIGQMTPIVVFSLAIVGLTGFIDGVGIALNWLAPAVVKWVGLGDRLASGQAEWLQNPVGTTNVAVVLFVLLLTWVAGSRRYRIRLPKPQRVSSAPTETWDAVYARLRPLDEPVTQQPARIALTGQDNESPPIIVVAVSGGGITAAVWAFAVLSELDRRTRTRGCDRTFPQATKLVTGASGGMLGAAYYTALAANPGAIASPTARRAARKAIAEDCLSPVVRASAFHDLVWSLLPLASSYDRGHALERAWDTNLAGALNMPLSSLRESERKGEIPSLVFSPMLVEDGRRLIISNTSFGWLEAIQPRSFVEFNKLFPKHESLLTVATASRMAATFPLISPAIVLPTYPRRRVVDAGYFDNYGVHLATAWVRQLFGQRNNDLPSIAFVEIRAFNRLEPQESSWFSRGWEDLMTPIHGLSTARSAVTAFRNDELVEQLKQMLGSKFCSFVFEAPGGLPLSWFLAPAERNRTIRGLTRNAAREEFHRFLHWWNHGHCPPDQSLQGAN